MHGSVRLGPGQEDPEPRRVGVRRPHLLAPDHPLVTVEIGPGGQRGQVGSGAGLAEQLAPDLLAGQQGHQVAVLLIGGPGEQDGGSGPSDPDGVGRVAAPRLVGAHRPRSAGGRGRRRSPTAGASAERPGRARPAAGPTASGCARNHDRAPSARRGSSSVGNAKSTRASVGSAAAQEERPLSTWNFGDVWEAVADELPDAPALTHGTTTLSWGELDRRADDLARWLLGTEVRHQDKVAVYLYNCSEYLEASFACFKLGLVAHQHQLPVRRRRARLPVGQRRRGGGRLPRRLRRPHRGHPRQAPGPSGPGCGSTTGRPPAPSGPSPTRRRPGRPGSRRPNGSALPGVAARTISTCSTREGPRACPRASCGARTTSSPASTAQGSGAIPRTGGRTTSAPSSRRSGPGMTLLPACPLMHGTGGFTALECLSEGGRVVTLTSRHVRHGRAARHRRPREGQRSGHRGRRLRQAHPGHPRRKPRPLGPVAAWWASSRPA